MNTTMTNFINLSAFDKDFKRLEKRYRTLPEDFSLLKRVLGSIYQGLMENTNVFVPIESFCGENYTSNKVRKFTCKALKGKGNQSGIRIIFVYEKEKQQITFVEIYYKGDKENEDKERLKNFISSIE